MSSHLFLDESKQSGYVVAVAVVQPESLATLRKAVRALAMPGQSRVHFQRESPARRRQILAALVSLDVRVRLYVAAKGIGETESRKACLEAVVDDAAALGARMLVLERDNPRVAWDKQVLLERTRKAGCTESLRYQHSRGVTEPLLWLPDAAAWCWARGKEWRRLGAELTEAVREV